MKQEVRVDPTKGDVVIVATRRSKRPQLFKDKKAVCPFDAGNEASTPHTRLILPSSKQWKVRSFDNLFAFVSPSNSDKHEHWFDSMPAVGRHEVIVEVRDHDLQIQDLGVEGLDLIILAYKSRFNELEADPLAKYVYLFKNHGKLAGASIPHEHSQIVSLNFTPPIIEKKEKHYSEYMKKMKKCFYCTVMRSSPVVFQNKHFTCVRPPVARFPFEVWLIPKTHCRNMTLLPEREFGLAIKETVKHLLKVCPDYNLNYYNASKSSKDFHFHIECIPRTTSLAGFELGLGVYINTQSEWQGAKKLK